MTNATEREQMKRDARIYGISVKRIHTDGRETRVDPFDLYITPEQSPHG